MSLELQLLDFFNVFCFASCLASFLRHLFALSELFFASTQNIFIAQVINKSLNARNMFSLRWQYVCLTFLGTFWCSIFESFIKFGSFFEFSRKIFHFQKSLLISCANVFLKEIWAWINFFAVLCVIYRNAWQVFKFFSFPQVFLNFEWNIVDFIIFLR